MRLRMLEDQRGLPNTVIDRPTAQRPLETLRAPAALAVGGGVGADLGGDSPYLAASRFKAQMEQAVSAAPPAGAPNQVLEGWRPIGPFSIPHGQTYGQGPTSRPSVSGRISSIAIDPGNAAHHLIGAAGGGVWESLDTGATWAPRTDAQATLTTGAIAFDPGNAQTVYAGTGEGDFYAWLGSGLLRSQNGGTTWNLLAGAPFVGIGFYDIVVDPLNGQHLLAATTGGLFESSNGGAAWASRRAQKTWDLSMHPSVQGQQNSTKEVFAGCGDGLQISNDGGTTWAAVNLPGAPVQWIRIEVCHAPSNGDVVYVFATGKGPQPLDPWVGYLWRRSIAAGAFVAVGFPQGLQVGQAWYDWCAAVAPNDPDVLYLGGIDLHKGVRNPMNDSWVWTNISAKINGDCVHPDQHHVAIGPTAPTVVYSTNDGGVFRSPDAGVSWRSLNKGLDIAEFEYLASHPQYDAWLIGGTQDNGTERYEAGEVWFHVQDGDGGHCGIDATSPATCFHTFFGMSLQRSTMGGSWGTWASINPPIPQNYVRLFYPPVDVNGTVVAQAGQSVFMSTDSGTNWTEVALPANEVATTLAISTVARVYVGTTQGNVYRIDLVNNAWQNPVALTQPRAGFVSDLLVDPNNASRIWVTYSNIAGGHVYRSDNAGTTWSDVSAGLPNIPANAVAVDPMQGDTAWVALDAGVFRTTTAGAAWTSFNNGLPNALATDLAFHQPFRLLRVGTRNRGVWEINVDRANMPDVEVYVRDSAVDTGRKAPSPSGADPFNVGSQTFWWESVDIKVDSPPFQFANLGDVDFEIFEDDHGVAATGLVHENTERNRTVRVYVQVHDRGPVAAQNVDVKVFFASAALGLPNLPAGFWTNFPNNVLPLNSPWQAIAPHKTVAAVECGRPAVVPFEWAVPAGQAAHSCLLAVVSAQNDTIATAELMVASLVLGQQKCGLKNLVVVDPPAAPPLPWVVLRAWWPFRRGRFSIGTGERGRESIRGILLGPRLSRYAQEAKLESRRITALERTALARRMRTERLPAESFDLERYYVPRPGPWLAAPATPDGAPDVLAVVFAPRPLSGRFSLVQWSENGVAVGGVTFVVRGAGQGVLTSSAG